MTLEQTVQYILQDIVEIKTKQNTDHSRIEENKALVAPIHKLSANIEHLTAQLKGQNERIDKLVDVSEGRLKGQGERIGKIESIAEKQTVIIQKLQKRIEVLEKDVDDIRTKGSKRLDGIIDGALGKIVCVVLGAILMFVFYQFGL